MKSWHLYTKLVGEMTFSPEQLEEKLPQSSENQLRLDLMDFDGKTELEQKQSFRGETMKNTEL
ncbi:hypothetical protein NC651_009763 [Populus alba x Populus x berolinensis]|nr:hypothetical protein NC651_009763 [Populus alba x Populus x berolinensis]